MEHENGKKRVVISGIGAITPLAVGAEKSWKLMRQGASGINFVRNFDTSGMRTKVAGEVTDFRAADFMDSRFERRFDRSILLGLAAGRMALEDARLNIGEDSAGTTAVIMGNALGGRNLLEANLDRINSGGSKRVSPYFIAGTLGSIISGQMAISLGARGPNLTVNAACASGVQAMGTALNMIRSGECEQALAGGTEAGITRLTFLGYDSMKVTSAENEFPARASRPFDRERDGFVPSEGSAVLVLESLSSALKRNARIYAEISGFGATCDAYHVTAPDPEAKGPEMCMQKAIKDAGLEVQDIDCINAHGTATSINDIAETRAIKSVFGSRSTQIPITANKSMLGHMIGAAGAAESVFSVFSIRDGIIPPTINYHNPDKDCDLDYVPNASRKKDISCVLCNSFGFGGNNAALVFRRYDG